MFQAGRNMLGVRVALLRLCWGRHVKSSAEHKVLAHPRYVAPLRRYTKKPSSHSSSHSSFGCNHIKLRPQSCVLLLSAGTLAGQRRPPPMPTRRGAWSRAELCLPACLVFGNTLSKKSCSSFALAVAAAAVAGAAADPPVNAVAVAAMQAVRLCMGGRGAAQQAQAHSLDACLAAGFNNELGTYARVRQQSTKNSHTQRLLMDRRSAAIINHQGGQLPKHACSNFDSFVCMCHSRWCCCLLGLLLLWLLAGKVACHVTQALKATQSPASHSTAQHGPAQHRS